MKRLQSTILRSLRAYAAHWAGYGVAVIPAAALITALFSHGAAAFIAANGLGAHLPSSPLLLAVLTAGGVVLALGGCLAAISCLLDVVFSGRRRRTRRRHIVGIALTTTIVVGLGGAVLTLGAMLAALPFLALSGALGGYVRWSLSPRHALQDAALTPAAA